MVPAYVECEILLCELLVCAPHLCSPGWSGTRYVDQTRFDLTEIGQAARALGLEMYPTRTHLISLAALG